MPPNDVSRNAMNKMFVAAVARFASSQSDEAMAKLIGFFHLAEVGEEAVVDFDVEASGLISVSIQMQCD